MAHAHTPHHAAGGHHHGNGGDGVPVATSTYARPEVQAAHPELAASVVGVVAANCKRGPFTSTAGRVLPYYLNLGTNFLDKRVASSIAEIYAHALNLWFRDTYAGQEVVCVGMEMAGGVVVSQLAALADRSGLAAWTDFLYIRKAVKTSGTRQRLEGPNTLTTRTPQSPPLRAIWVDDCLSTGSSLATTAAELKADYNIVVDAALFLVDRSVDRATAPKDAAATILPWAIDIRAVFDLDAVDSLLPAHLRFRG